MDLAAATALLLPLLASFLETEDACRCGVQLQALRHKLALLLQAISKALARRAEQADTLIVSCTGVVVLRVSVCVRMYNSSNQ